MNFDEWKDKEISEFSGLNVEHLEQAFNAGKSAERYDCANILGMTRADASLMAGEMTIQEWRTLSAVLKGLQAKIRSRT